jgi:hypothetical protein
MTRIPENRSARVLGVRMWGRPFGLPPAFWPAFFGNSTQYDPSRANLRSPRPFADKQLGCHSLTASELPNTIPFDVKIRRQWDLKARSQSAILFFPIGSTAHAPAVSPSCIALVQFSEGLST